MRKNLKRRLIYQSKIEKKHEMEITTDPRIVKVLQSSSMLSSNSKNLICM